jgi:hypothetical protein
MQRRLCAGQRKPLKNQPAISSMLPLKISQGFVEFGQRFTTLFLMEAAPVSLHPVIA